MLIAKKDASDAPVVFEDLLEMVGGTGRWQAIVVGLAALAIVQVPLHSLGSTFLAGEQKYRCAVPGEVGDNTTAYEPNNSTALHILNEWLVRDNDTGEWTSCSRLAVRGDHQGIIVPCETWIFSKTIYESTIVQQWSLVCSRKWMKASVQSSYMLGCLIGSILTGILSDRYGRRFTICFASLLFFVFNMATSFTKSYTAFVALRFLSAIPRGGLYCTLYILCVELCGARHRATVGLLINLPYAMGVVLLSGLAYVVRDWMSLQLTISSLGALFLVYWLLLPESPRWLILHGLMERAQFELERAARWNGFHLTHASKLELQRKMELYRQLELNEKNCSAQTQVSSPSNLALANNNVPLEIIENKILDESNNNCKRSMIGCRSLSLCTSTLSEMKRLVETKQMRRISAIHCFNWTVIAMCYYGITLDAARLSSSPYLAIALSGVLEVPAYLCALPLVTALGRRHSIVLIHSLTALALLLMLAVSERTAGLQLTLQMIGRFAVTASYGIIYLYSAECFPTVLRNVGVGLCGTFEDMGSIAAPYVVDLLGDWHWSVPSVVFGVAALAAAVAILHTPETAQSVLPDTVQDLQHRLATDAASLNNSSRRNGSPLDRH